MRFMVSRRTVRTLGVFGEDRKRFPPKRPLGCTSAGVGLHWDFRKGIFQEVDLQYANYLFLDSSETTKPDKLEIAEPFNFLYPSTKQKLTFQDHIEIFLQPESQ